MTTSANTNRRWKKPLSVKELTTPTNQSSSSIIKIVQSTAALLISQLVEFSGTLTWNRLTMLVKHQLACWVGSPHRCSNQCPFSKSESPIKIGYCISALITGRHAQRSATHRSMVEAQDELHAANCFTPQAGA